MLTYAILLGLSLIVASWSRGAVLRCTLAVAANWIVGMLVSHAGWVDAWPVNIVIDVLTAWVILRNPAGRWQSILGVSFCAQIAMHVGYGANIILFSHGDMVGYYNALTVVAFLQLAVTGGWNGDLWRVRAYRRRGLHSHAAASGAPRLGFPG